MYSDTVDKANVLNQQFQSVFTPKCPLKLSQLASMAVQDFSDNGTIDPTQIPGECLNTTPQMESITVSTNGIAKLLKDLNPHKAAGPDQIKPLVLQKLRDVIAPILQVIFQRSLNTGMERSLCMSTFPKRRHQSCIKLETYLTNQYTMQST